MRKTLTDRGVKTLKPRAARYSYPDPEQRGLYVRIQPSGTKSFVAVALDPNGKQVWATLGPTSVLQIAEARQRARDAIRRIRDGLPPFQAPPIKPDSFEHVAEHTAVRQGERVALASGSDTTAARARLSGMEGPSPARHPPV